MSKALVIGVTVLVLSAASASAQVYLTSDYGYAAPVADLAAPAYGYAAATYVAPGPVYAVPPVYAAPVYAGPPVYAVPAPRYGTMPPHMATRPAAVNGLLKEVGSDSEARGFGGFNDHLKKPDGGQCAACGRSFIGGGTEQPRDRRLAIRPATSQRQALQQLFRLELLVIAGHGTTECT